MDYEPVNKSNIIYSSNAEYLMYITIGIVYVTLISLLVDRVLGLEKLEDDCEFKFVGNMTIERRQFDDQRRTQCKARRDAYQDKRFAHMMIIGVISLLVGGYITTLNGSYNVAGAGMALGGLFSVIYTSISHWHRITTDLKILMLVVALATLGYGSTLVF